MDLRQLRYFITVAEELHFGRAADRLGITQPPLSQAIQALEEAVGVLLFHRTKRSVALTPVGEQWLPHVRRVLEQAGSLPELARQLSRGEIGLLRLAFVSTADYSVLPVLIRRYRSLYADVQIALREATSDLQIEALLAGQIDAGLIIPPSQSPLHPALAYRPLLREPLVAAVPESWMASGQVVMNAGQVDVQALADAPLILFPRPSAPAFHDIITGYFVRQGLTPRLGQQAIQMQTIISLVSAGLGIALVPASLQNLGRAGVCYAPLRGTPPDIETGLVWRPAASSPALERFIQTAMADGETPQI